MFIAKMTIKTGEAPPFSAHTEFSFDEHVNVFVGPNASGKTTALQQVLHNYRREWAGADDTSKPELSFINNRVVHLTDSEHCVFALENDDDTPNTHKFDLIIVPATRVRYRAGYEEDGLSVGQIADSQYHTFYGVSSLSEVIYEDYIHDTVMAMYRLVEEKIDPLDEDYYKFHDHHLEIFEDDPSMVGESLQKALAVAYECAKNVCREVITGDKPGDKRVIQDVASESTLPSAEVHFELGVSIETDDIREGSVDPLDMTSLSAGTEGTLWWTRLIALSLLLMHDFKPGWEKRRAILLIDEIENHLHPTWQRRVIPALLEHFPGLQIFATTHSPFAVAGLKKGQVHILKRGANGVITYSPNEHDIIGWTTDEILRTFMGVDEPTDQLTIDRRERLLELRRKDSLTDEEAAEMEELRRRVNEDFLSSSTPLEAQRERYGDMMLEFLRSRQSELSQDGG